MRKQSCTRSSAAISDPVIRSAKRYSMSLCCAYASRNSASVMSNASSQARVKRIRWKLRNWGVAEPSQETGENNVELIGLEDAQLANRPPIWIGRDGLH